MKVSVIHGRELAAAERQAWSDLQQANDLFGNPYFCPQYAEAAAHACEGVFIAVMEHGSHIGGFFPFQVETPGEALPAGTRMCDYQGVVAAQEFVWSAEDLLARCGLRSWTFNHLIAAQRQFANYHAELLRSPMVDLSRGLEAWTAEVGKRSWILKRSRAALRRLEREWGPVRFEAHSDDAGMLRRLLACKSKQYVRTGRPDHFRLPWRVALAKRIHATQEPDFAGLLSVLYAGERPVAYHLGIRSRRIWHYWLPCYDPVYARYSPGIILLLKMVEYAVSAGLTAIDLGRGESQYKLQLMNASIPLAQGRVEIAALAPGLRRAVHAGTP